MTHSVLQQVKVSLGERSYDILVGSGLLDRIGTCLSGVVRSPQVAVVADATVAGLYAKPVLRALKRSGYQVRLIILPPGERTKTLRALACILDELVAARFERGAALVALGGGVIGDLAGFAAAVYLRGIAFIQVPTTLIAQVDSSVGGKTGVNHPLGKNLIGAFHQPRLVLIDVRTLQTLPRREWVAGLAEVIKYGVIADERFFAYLEEQMEALLKMDEEAIVRVVTRSCEIKAAIVMEDERESDRRRTLNYGHTIGHALEALGGYRHLIHGEAVGIGMVQEAGLAAALGYCSRNVVLRQRELVGRAGLPTELPKIGFPQLWRAMQHDKKVAQGRVYCVVPQRIGEVCIVPLEREACRRWFAGRRPERTATSSRTRAVRPVSGRGE
ncbi:3-dehydroquinate synthase [Candidatus Nitrospira bockiana]